MQGIQGIAQFSFVLTPDQSFDQCRLIVPGFLTVHQLLDNRMFFQQFLNALKRQLRILGIESARHMDQDGFGRLLSFLRHDCYYPLGYRGLR